MKRLAYLFLLFLIHKVTLAHNDKLIYVENKGQWEQNILFKSEISGGALFLESNKLTFHLKETHRNHASVEPIEVPKVYKGFAYNIEFLNSNLHPKIVKENKVETYFNYFIGDSSHWRGDCKGYETIIYQEIYPHIDLKINSASSSAKYTFILKEHANIEDIRLRYNGIEYLKLDPSGNIIIETNLGFLTDVKPLTFFVKDNIKTVIGSQYVVEKNIVKFKTDYFKLTSNQSLEIDPQIIFSSYSGSTTDNFGATATYDVFGNLYGAGLAFGTGYPTTLGAYSTTFGGNSDVGITKFSPNGSSRVYSTYLGGSSFDAPHSMVVDQNNRLIIFTTTSSQDYPTTAGAFRTVHSGGPPISLMNGIGILYPNGADIGITKFNPSGTGLVASTYFGGNGTDGIDTSASLSKNYGDVIRGEVLTDTLDNVYIVSTTTSTNLPALSNSFKATNSGGYDGILCRFNTNLTNLVGFTYVGGSAADALYDMSFDNAGNIVAAGGTSSSNIGPTAGVVAPTYSGSTDGMIVSFNNLLSTNRFTTYYGTTGYDQIYFVELDRSNNIYVLGQTNFSASGYYTFNAGYSTGNTGQMISIFNPLATTRLRSTTIGAGSANPDFSPTAFLVDYCSKIFITGWGSNLSGNSFVLSTTGLPITANAFQSSTLGNGFYMAILEGDLSALYYGSFFGGTASTSREHVDGGTSRFDKNGIIYHAVCAGCGGNNNLPIFPSTSAVVAGSNGNAPNGNCNLGVFKFDFGLPVKANFASSTNGCAPTTVSFSNLSHIVGKNPKYQWNFSSGGTSTLANPTITVNTAGVYTARLIVTDSASCNIKDTITKTFIVLGTLLSDTLSDKIVCAGNSVRIGFPNIIDTSLTVSWTPSTLVDDPTILAPFANPTTTTIYRVIVNKRGCFDTFYQKVIVETPSPITISGNSSLCINTTSRYIATKYSTGTYDWNPKTALSSSNRDTAIFNFPILPTTIVLTYTTVGGCISTASFPVGLSNNQLRFSGDSIGCLNDTLTIGVVATPANGVFSFTPSSNIISSTSTSIKVKLDTTKYIVVNYSLGANCKVKDSFKIILLKDKVDWTVDSFICKNNNAIATVNTIGNFSTIWSPASLLTTVQGESPANFNLSNVEQKIYIEVKGDINTSCSFKDSAMIRFIDNKLNLTADQTRCKDSGILITSNYVNGITYNWTPANLIVSKKDSTCFFKTNNSKYYYLEMVGKSGCKVKDSIYITVINDLMKITGDSIICKKDTANFSATFMQNATYSWYPKPKIISGDGTPISKSIIDVEQWFYVYVEDTNKCFLVDSIKPKIYDSTHYIKSDFTATTNCINSTVQFTNKSYDINSNPMYLWDFGGGNTSSATNPTFSFNSAGIKTVKLIISDNSLNICNGSDTAIKQIIILNNIRDTLPLLKKCKGDSVQIGLENVVDPNALILWTPNAKMRGSTTFYPKVKVDQTTTFMGIVTKNGCTDTIYQTVEIDDVKLVDLSGDSIACQFTEKTFVSTQYTNGVYTWEPSSFISYQNKDTARFIINNDNFKIIVKYTTDYGCIAKDSVTIKLVNTTIKLTMDTVECKGDTLNISYVTSPKGGAVTFSPTSLIFNQTLSTAKFVMDTTRTISALYYIDNRCQMTDTVRVKLLKDAVNWTVDTFVCKNYFVEAKANSSSRWNYIWSPSSSLVTPQSKSPARFNVSNAAPLVKIHTTLLSNPMCTFSDSVQIVFINDSLKLSADQTRCKDSGVVITSTKIPNGTYNWYPTNLIISTNNHIARFKTDSSRYYYLDLIDNSGCIVRDSIYITVINDLLKVTADSIVCDNDTATITATAMVGANYVWSNGKTTSKIIENFTDTKTYYLTVTDTNTCVLYDSVKVLVLDENNVAFLNSDLINCKKDTLTITSKYLPNVSYTWSPNNLILSGQGTNEVRSFINANTTFYVDVKIKNRFCTFRDSIRFFKDTNYLKISGTKVICLNDTIHLAANYNPNFTYSWTPINWAQLNNHLVDYILTDSTWYYCNAVHPALSKCIYNDSFFVDYSRLLSDLTVTANPIRIEYGKSSQLTATTLNGTSYLWSPTTSLDKYFIHNPVATPEVTTRYYVTVTDRLSCRSVDSVDVDVYFEVCGEPEVFIPNTFTPNSDGKNDVLYVRGDNIIRVYFAIYDRWGQLIFETTHVKKGWDGTFKGAQLEPGVFAYILNVDCIGGGHYTKSGNITLLK